MIALVAVSVSAVSAKADCQTTAPGSDTGITVGFDFDNGVFSIVPGPIDGGGGSVYDHSGHIESAHFATGSPGAKWYYAFDYTASPKPNGNGWYIKSIRNLTVNAYYPWWYFLVDHTAYVRCLSFNYSLTPTQYPTTVRVSAELLFTSSTNPSGYTESVSNSTEIVNNVVQDFIM